MIQSNELRIGNCISYDGWHPDLQLHNKPMPAYNVQVAGLNIEDDKIVIECVSGERAFESCYEPIPLSPEILEKCGLKVINGYHVFRNGRYVIIPMSNAYTLFLNKIESAPDFMELITGFNFLHQLQNLYFALTGEELNYKQ